MLKRVKFNKRYSKIDPQLLLKNAKKTYLFKTFLLIKKLKTARLKY